MSSCGLNRRSAGLDHHSDNALAVLAHAGTDHIKAAARHVGLLEGVCSTSARVIAEQV